MAGCGGSKSTSSTTAPAPPSTTSASAPPAPTTSPTTRTQALTTSTTTSAKTTATATTGSINVRVPARFTILANGSVSPPTVAIPAHLPVELIVVSNGAAHRITLRTPHPAIVTVQAHGQAEKLIDGLPAGSYPLLLDGARKATLSIGGSPGP